MRRQQLYVSDGGAGNAQGDWTELASGRSDQMLNGFYDNDGYQSFTQAGSTTIFGDVVAYGVAPTDTDGAQLRSMMMQRAGLPGLLSPLPQTVSTSGTTYITSSAVSSTASSGTLILPPVAAAQNEQVVIYYAAMGGTTVKADQGSDILFNGSTSGASSLNLLAGQRRYVGVGWHILECRGSDRNWLGRNSARIGRFNVRFVRQFSVNQPYERCGK